MEQLLLCNQSTEYGQGVYRILLDTIEGKLSHFKRILLEQEVNDIQFDRQNHLLLACKTDQGGGVACYENNMLNYKLLDRSLEEPSAPLRLALQKEWNIVVSIHKDGSLYSYSIEKSGQLIREDQVEVNEALIDGIFTKDNILILSSAKEAALLCYQVSPQGKLSFLERFNFPHLEAFMHLTFHSQNRYFYALNKERHTVEVFSYEIGGVIRHLSSHSTLSKGHKGTAVDMVLWKDRHLYIINRGTNTIANFQIEADGAKVRYLQSISCEGLAPLSLALNRQRNFLCVANTLTHNMSLFHIDAEGQLRLCSDDTKTPGLNYIVSSEI